MGKENIWFEEITAYLFEEYKTFFLNKTTNYEKHSVKTLLLGMEGIVVGHDIDNDTAKSTSTQYSLGIYTPKQLVTLGPNKIEWPVSILEKTENFWGPPSPDTDLWSSWYEVSEKFEQFQLCTVLASVAESLLNDHTIKPYLDKALNVILDIDGKYDTPMFRIDIPSKAIKEKVVSSFVSTEKNKKLFLSTWNKKTSEPGTKLLKQLGISPLPDYPSKDEIEKVLAHAKREQAIIERKWRKEGDKGMQESKIKTPQLTETGKNKNALKPKLPTPTNKNILKPKMKASITAKNTWSEEGEIKSKRQSNEIAINILEPYLIDFPPYGGNLSNIPLEIKDSLKTYERASNHLGMCFKALGDSEKAEQWWRRCYEVLPGQTGTLNLCILYRGKNDKELKKINDHLRELKKN